MTMITKELIFGFIVCSILMAELFRQLMPHNAKTIALFIGIVSVIFILLVYKQLP